MVQLTILDKKQLMSHIPEKTSQSDKKKNKQVFHVTTRDKSSGGRVVRHIKAHVLSLSTLFEFPSQGLVTETPLGL